MAMTDTQPRRGDAFEQWLKTQRDAYEQTTGREWRALDEVLDTYRLHADTHTPLDEHVCYAQAVGDCDCLEKPPTAQTQTDQPDMTPGACTHHIMIRHVGGDPTRWSCLNCDMETGTRDCGPDRPVHPLWPAETVPAA